MRQLDEGIEIPAISDGDETDELNAEFQAARADWAWDAVAAEADQVSGQLESEIRETDPDLIARSERLLAGTLGNGAFHAMTHFGWLVDADIGVDADRVSEYVDEVVGHVRASRLPPSEIGAGIYNAACFRALHGQLDQARELLREAFQLDPELVAFSKQDDDLIATARRTRPARAEHDTSGWQCLSAPSSIAARRGRSSVAFGLDWPGWSRGAKTAEVALETLESYRERYRPIAALAGMAREFDAAGPLEIVEDKVGTPSTDFWAISFAPSLDGAGSDGRRTNWSAGSRCCVPAGRSSTAWPRASRPRCSKGPRGGGRERDEIIRHVFRVESLDFAEAGRSGVAGWPDPRGEELHRYREDYVAGMRAYNAGQFERRMRKWTLPFLIRHSAFHTLDHAWEMEDKDLSANAQSVGRHHEASSHFRGHQEPEHPRRAGRPPGQTDRRVQRPVHSYFDIRAPDD